MGMGTVDIRKKTMSSAPNAAIKGMTRDQMEELAQNRDNLVLNYEESKDPTKSHAFSCLFIKRQLMDMRAMFEDYLATYTTYTEDEVRNKVLNSSAARENSWRMLTEKQPNIFGHAIKKFATKEDRKKYDTLLKIVELECLREKGLITTEAQIDNYWKAVGIHKDLNPIKDALDKLK